MVGLPLAREHWEYSDELLELNNLIGKYLYPAQKEIIKKFYISVFIHGYKHGVEDTEIPRAPNGRFIKKIQKSKAIFPEIKPEIADFLQKDKAVSVNVK